MQLRVRKAELGDAARMAEIHIAAWRKAYSPFMHKQYLESLDLDQRKTMWASVLSNNEAGNYLVCELNNTVEGFSVFGSARDDDLSKSEAELIALNVSPHVWRKKVGTNLLSKVLEETTKSNYSAIYLWVIEGNDAAIELYKKFAFVPDGVSKIDTTHSANPIKEIRYVKRLS